MSPIESVSRTIELQIHAGTWLNPFFLLRFRFPSRQALLGLRAKPYAICFQRMINNCACPVVFGSDNRLWFASIPCLLGMTDDQVLQPLEPRGRRKKLNALLKAAFELDDLTTAQFIDRHHFTRKFGWWRICQGVIATTCRAPPASAGRQCRHGSCGCPLTVGATLICNFEPSESKQPRRSFARFTKRAVRDCKSGCDF
jgi:hypothetical protein